MAITCGVLPDREGVANEVFCSEPLLVGLRPQHRLAGESAVSLSALAPDVLGATAGALFPAWALVQQQALEAAAISPPQVALAATDLAGTRWMEQSKLDWIMLIGSLAGSHTDTVIRPVTPAYAVVFTLQWNPARAQTPAVAKFVSHALRVGPPAGWSPGPGHLGPDPARPDPALEVGDQVRQAW